MLFAFPLQLPPGQPVAVPGNEHEDEHLVRQVVKHWGLHWVRRLLDRIHVGPPEAEEVWSLRRHGPVLRCFLLHLRRGGYERGWSEARDDG